MNSDFQRLAKEACDIVYIALIVHEAQESVEREMFDRNLEDLVECGLQCLHK
jgi:hypothetical protein